MVAKTPVTEEKTEPKVEAPPKERRQAPSKRQSALGFAEDVEETIKDAVPPLTEEEVKKLIETVRRLGFHETQSASTTLWLRPGRGYLGGNEPRPNRRSSASEAREAPAAGIVRGMWVSSELGFGPCRRLFL